MKTEQTQPTELNLTVTRDGYLDTEYLRSQRIATISHTAIQAVESVSEATRFYVGGFIGNMATAARTGLHDKVFGTDYNAQFFSDLDKAREERFSRSLGLVAVGKK